MPTKNPVVASNLVYLLGKLGIKSAKPMLMWWSGHTLKELYNNDYDNLSHLVYSKNSFLRLIDINESAHNKSKCRSKR